jgi:hypothetical protein
VGKTQEAPARTIRSMLLLIAWEVWNERIFRRRDTLVQLL